MVLMIVGLTLMKISSCSHRVSAPKTSTMTPDKSGMIGRVRVRIQDTDSAMAVAIMKQAVPTKIGPPISARNGTRSAIHSPRELAKKNTTSGPSSSTILSSGLMCLRLGSLGSRSKISSSCSAVSASV